MLLIEFFLSSQIPGFRKGLTDIIEEFKAQQVGSTSSMLMLQLEELRLSIAAISYSTCSEAEKIKRLAKLFCTFDYAFC